ncbi:hypothetical protein [uncultured Treponema sp.]|uniref:hypothetical protein n=1 Tax=uncultured Treponema sp. TaxID=162155 RepID=UPI00258AE124|nr:hypothetical protein [uncultured Treponema sp.]
MISSHIKLSGKVSLLMDMLLPEYGGKLRFFFEENKVDNFGKSVSKLINVYDLNRIKIEKLE